MPLVTFRRHRPEICTHNSLLHPLCTSYVVSLCFVRATDTTAELNINKKRPDQPEGQPSLVNSGLVV